MKRLLLFLCTALLTAGAEEPTGLLAEVDKTTAARRTELKAKLEKIDAAITAAVKEAALKPSTEAYFRDCLSHFQTTTPGLPEADRVYFPPRFDSNPAIEPINLAWADMRAEFTRQQREQDKLSSRLVTAAADALAAAARNAEHASEFAPVEKLLAQVESMADPGRTRRAGYSEYDEREQLNVIRNLSQTMGEILEAQRARDQARFAEALSELSEPTSISRYARFPALSAAETKFRTRMLAPYRAEALQLQTKLEDGLMARRPAEALDALLNDYSAKAKQLSALLTSIDRSGEFTNELLRAYRGGAQMLLALASGDPGARADMSYSSTLELPFIHPALYRAFLQQLQRELKRAAEAGAPAGGDLLKVRAEVRQKLNALPTPEAATALADALPGLLPDRARDFDQETQDLRGALSSLAQELHELAVAWVESGMRLGSLAGGQERRDGPFSLEMHRLRQRVWRDALVALHELPELKQPPYAALPVEEALAKLSETLADLGDWKKSLAMADLLHLPPEESFESVRSRAIRMYLVAVNLELSEEYSPAVEAYLQVLVNVADHTPIAETTDRLKKLRAAHPDAFESSDAKALESLRKYRNR